MQITIIEYRMITVIVGNQAEQSNRKKGHLRLLNSIRIILPRGRFDRGSLGAMWIGCR